MKYDCEAFHSKDDAQCSICLGEYKEKEILRIIPTCHHNFHLTCLDVWLQKQTTCPICRISLKELQAAMSSARGIQQLPTVPENSVNPTDQWFVPVHQDHRGQNNSSETQESVEVIIEIRQ
uniref:RING-type domain-containing protein n=1 Tax=Arundo donax TaxID=35708 RepID=A0A0A9AMJ6_ARUDO